jgi:hypothetical protein
MVEDVVAWLPHSPMLSFDIIPSFGGGIGILPWLFISFFLIFFVGTRNPSSNQFLSPFNK